LIFVLILPSANISPSFVPSVVPSVAFIII
jgi:hypothetical protein